MVSATAKRVSWQNKEGILGKAAGSMVENTSSDSKSAHSAIPRLAY